MDFAGKKILIVASDFPYPTNHGARMDIWGRMLALKQLGFYIDLVATVKEKPGDEELAMVRKIVSGDVIICQRKVRFIDLLSIQPLQAKSRGLLKKIPLERDYDILLLESEYNLSILDNPSLRVGEIVLRIHNDEEKYLRELSRSARFGIRKLYYWLESFKCRKLKAIVAAKIKNVMLISLVEYHYFTGQFPEKNAIYLPPPLPPRMSRKTGQDTSKVIFVGSLFMANNREAVDWYLKWIHPYLTDIHGYELIIAGNSRGDGGSWYDRLTTLPRVTFYNSPVELGPLYEKSSLFINPMLHGAGVKLKVVDAIINGLPVVSTTIGAEGTGLYGRQHLLIANDPVTFAAAVREVLLNPVLGEELVLRAQRYMTEHYDQVALLGKFLKPLVGGEGVGSGKQTENSRPGNSR